MYFFKVWHFLISMIFLTIFWKQIILHVCKPYCQFYSLNIADNFNLQIMLTLFTIMLISFAKVLSFYLALSQSYQLLKNPLIFCHCLISSEILYQCQDRIYNLQRIVSLLLTYLHDCFLQNLAINRLYRCFFIILFPLLVWPSVFE